MRMRLYKFIGKPNENVQELKITELYSCEILLFQQ